jgi:hypothetical protein
MEGLLESYHRQHYADPQDVVFALLGLPTLSHHAVQVNCNLSTAKLSNSAFEHVVHNTYLKLQDHEVYDLCTASESALDLDHGY